MFKLGNKEQIKMKRKSVSVLRKLNSKTTVKQ